MKYMIVIAAVFAASLVQAGQEVGNGGNVVVCAPSGRPQTVELLDHYEAREELGLTLDLGGPDLAVDAKVQLAINRLARIAPERAKSLEGFARDFMDSAVLLPDANLVPVGDSYHLAVPKDCSVVQVAIQREPEFPGQKTYTVNKDLWDQLDNGGKAGLILHEILYREARRAGATDSIGVRYLNGMLSSPAFERITVGEFTIMAQNIPFDWVECQGFVFKVGKKLPIVDSEFVPLIAGGPLAYRGEMQIGGWPAYVDEVYFDPAGHVHQVHLVGKAPVDFGGYPLEFTGTLKLDAKGVPYRGTVVSKSVFSIGSGMMSLEPDSKDKDIAMGRDPSGRIVECGACKGWVTLAGRSFQVSADPTGAWESYDLFGAYNLFGSNDDDSTFDMRMRLFLAAPAEFDVVAPGVKARFVGPVVLDAHTLGHDLFVESGQLAEPTELPLGEKHETLVKLSGKVEFSDIDGAVLSGSLAAATDLADQEGNVRTYPAGTLVNFNRQGRLISAETP